MNDLILNGAVTIDGMTFQDIEGGFGPGKKAMLVADIAEIHGKEVREINQNINENRERFIDGIDIVDLKGSEISISLADRDIMTKSSIANSKNIYLLSELGYATLLKILKDETAWAQYKKLVNGYFSMRKEVVTHERILNGLLLVYNQQNEIINRQNEVIAKVDRFGSDISVIKKDQGVLVKSFKQFYYLKSAVASATESLGLLRDQLCWRASVMHDIDKVVPKKTKEAYASVYRRTYAALEKIKNIDLKAMLNNFRAGDGSGKKVSKLDVIEADPDLRECYSWVVKKLRVGG